MQVVKHILYSPFILILLICLAEQFIKLSIQKERGMLSQV